MESVKVKVIRTAVTAMYGTLSDGDILVTSAEFAKHLVEDCNAGEYLSVESPIQAAVVSENKPSGRKSKA